MAVADPSGTVQERYVYTVDGLPQAVSVNWTARTVGTVLHTRALWAGTGFIGASNGSRPSRTLLFNRNGAGSTCSAAGAWYDPVHARRLQPNLSGYGDPQTNPYQMTAWGQFGATAAPVILGIGVTLATGGLVPVPIAAALGGAVICGLSSYAAGSDASQIATDAAIGGLAGAVGGAVGKSGGAGCRAAGLSAISMTCETGFGTSAGFAVGAAEGGAYGAAEGFTRTATHRRILRTP